MPDRSWYYAAAGQQQGPYTETQLREFIARGAVMTHTLVWTEGMSGWQKAGDIPGLLSSVTSPAPAAPPRAEAPVAAGDTHASPMTESMGSDGPDGPLWIDIPLWPFLGRSLLFVIGIVLVIPAPWAATYFYRWVVEHIHVPSRPNLSFTGEVGDIWYVFVAIGICAYSRSTGSSAVQLVVLVLQSFLGWMVIKWIVGNIASNGQRLPLTFDGSALGYIGWQMLMILAVITIIGWAWVIPPWMRWICRNISGGHRDLAFNGTGVEILWRTLVFAFGCALIIPIPWLLRWYTEWYTAQFAVVPRQDFAGTT